MWHPTTPITVTTALMKATSRRNGVDNAPLHALANAATGGNGVYAYGASSVFPTQTWNSANYWVDVVFQPGAPAALTITTTSLPNGTVGSAYSATLAASGGTPPYTWSLSGSLLPAGLTLNASTGAITGTPTTTGTFPLTVQVAAGAQSATKAFTITIAAPAPPTITTTSLPNGTVGSAYSATLAASGGTPPYTWSLASGSLPRRRV